MIAHYEITRALMALEVCLFDGRLTDDEREALVRAVLETILYKK